ncbi:hypothetical protein V9T40_001891 [Parthenolecanium corni]|uniref:Juvenile hormone binding protein n=1 Tax=Parthenolecanium corni TaxID=536013 RepID=A0AAN9TF81_9HEMI
MLNDDKLVTCIRKGLAFLRTFFKQMQTSDGGIPVSGGSIESWRVNNIEIDILSYDAKLYKCDEFEIEQVVSKLSDGTITVKTLWPTAYLAESYILGGIIDKKKVAGSGRFKITVTNFSASLDVKFQENESNVEIKDLKFDANFENVEVTISGLEVEGNENPETLMNNAIQKDKDKFKEMLQANTTFLSKQALVVMNLQLKRTTKKAVVDTVTSWCNL